MARNKYPEETVSRILDAAMRLFREKGFEHTTIQDIVDQLDVTKGAVYHHFKSKEDILDAAIDRESEPLMRLLVEIRDDPRMTWLLYTSLPYRGFLPSARRGEAILRRLPHRFRHAVPLPVHLLRGRPP